jgi:hypothetical protein
MKYLLSRLVFLCVFLAGAAFGGWKLVEGSRAIIDLWESGHWPIVAGQVTESQIQVSGGHRAKSTSTPVVSYVYTVAGKTLTGSVITPADAGLNARLTMWRPNSPWEAGRPSITRPVIHPARFSSPAFTSKTCGRSSLASSSSLLRYLLDLGRFFPFLRKTGDL